MWIGLNLSELFLYRFPFILFSASSLQSLLRAFLTLSLCVRSWAACVKWWRVTFSSSQVGVLEAQKPHNDILHKMKKKKKKEKALLGMTPTYKFVRSAPLTENVMFDPASSVFFLFFLFLAQIVEMCFCHLLLTSWVGSWTTTRVSLTMRPASSCSAQCWTIWTARMWWGIHPQTCTDTEIMSAKGHYIQITEKETFSQNDSVDIS